MNNSQQNACGAHMPSEPVRREAYERAMAILNGRNGLGATANLSVVREYDGPVIVGSSTSLRYRT